MSIRFRNREQNQLTKWIGGRKKYTLLYKASRDGCTHTAFRNNCNNKGPTVTVLYNTDNFMYGGYTSASWKSIGNYQNDGSAFLFRFYQNGKWKPVRMPVVNAQNAIYDHPSYGPTFGGHDLHTFSNTVNFDGTSFPLNGSASFGVSYTMNGENYNSIANGHLRVKDIRVYLVEDLAGDTPLDGSWRKTAKWNPKYRMYQIRNGQSGTPMNFRLHDTRGLEADQGIDSHEMNYLLDGNLPDRHQFNPSVPISGDTAGFVVSPNLNDKIHCVIFVLDGSIVDVMPEKVIERMKNLQLRMNQRGIPQVVLLTKIDKVCEATATDISQVFYSPVIQESVDRVSQIMGLPRSHILPIKNYESETELNANVNILALLTLQQVLHFANDYMYNYLDQIEEGKVRQLNIRE